MTTFDASKKWVVFIPPDDMGIRKAAEDLAGIIGLLSGGEKIPLLSSAQNAAIGNEAHIVLNYEEKNRNRNGFCWRVSSDRLEILGESCRGLCNGIYSFIESLGVNRPAPGLQELPSPMKDKIYNLKSERVHESSHTGIMRRYIAGDDGQKIDTLLKKADTLSEWTASNRYDAMIFPFTSFLSKRSNASLKQLKQYLNDYDISLEAGGELSLLLPRRYFLLHRDYFRMEEGKRVSVHHFCPTSPGAAEIVRREAEKLFTLADVEVYRFYADKGAENVWCSCPCCRAFTPPEQGRIALNIAADVLSKINPEAFIYYSENTIEGIKIPLRENVKIV